MLIDSLEALIERVWTQLGRELKYVECLTVLDRLELALQTVAISEIRFDLFPTIFRVNNIKLLIANHLGDTVISEKIIACQNTNGSKLSGKPEFFHMLLDFKLIEIEHFSRSINTYREVWQLLDEEANISEFNKSKFWIKSEMAFLRVCTLMTGELDIVIRDQLNNKFETLKNLISNSTDMSRLRNYQLLYLLKSENAPRALELAKDHFLSVTDISSFDLFWLLNVINTQLIQSKFTLDNGLSEKLKRKLNDPKLLLPGHPNDLIWREVALFHWLNGDKSLSLKAIRKAQNQFNLHDSPISVLLKNMMMLYEDMINNKFKVSTAYFTGLPYVISKDLSVNQTLVEIRRLSPY
jgi:hypothetical protein